MISAKTEVSGVLKNRIGLIESEQRAPVEILRYDNGTELHAFMTWASTEKDPPIKA